MDSELEVGRANRKEVFLYTTSGDAIVNVTLLSLSPYIPIIIPRLEPEKKLMKLLQKVSRYHPNPGQPAENHLTQAVNFNLISAKQRISMLHYF